jgi:hypothetical protein
MLLVFGFLLFAIVNELHIIFVVGITYYLSRPTDPTYIKFVKYNLTVFTITTFVIDHILFIICRYVYDLA